MFAVIELINLYEDINNQLTSTRRHSYSTDFIRATFCLTTIKKLL